MEGCEIVGQDGAQFEDALRRLNALESKLAGQVLEDISELRKKWVQARVDRVSNNTYKLYQVRKSLKQSKMLYVEEDQLLEEFARVKAALLANSMDDDTFDAAKETCLVLGGKLSDVRSRQLICYSDSRDLETEINQNIMKLTFDKKDFNTLDLKEVRSNTPLRELSPTPLDKHRSRDPSPFRMPPLKLTSGTTTPGDSQAQDPHAYFSRPDSSQSIYGQRGTKLDMDSFRAAMEAKQMEDESPPQRRGQPSQPPGFQAQLAKSASGNIVLRSASGVVLCRSDGTEGGTSGSMFDSERPSSAMSDASINIPDLASHSRPSSRLGDDVSGMFDPFSEVPASFEPVTASTDSGRVMSLNEDKDKYLQEKKKHREEKQRLEAEEKERNKRKEEEEKILADKLKQEKALAEEKKKLLQQKAEEKQRLEAEEERKRVELRQIEKEKKEKEELRIRNEKKLAEEKAEKLRQEADEKKKILQQKAEEKRLLEEEKKAKKLEDERRKTEEKRVLEEEKKAKKLEEQRKAEEKRILEEEKKAKKLEEQRKAQEKIAIEEEKKAKKLEEQIKAEEDKKRMEAERKRKEEEGLQQTKTDSKQRSFVKKKSDSKPKDKVGEEPQPTASETPLLGKPKRRTSSTDPLSDTGRDSPVSILKGGKLSRDCSRDRAAGSDTDEILPGKPLSRTGSLKKSSSFSKKGILAEKKKISFDDVDMDKFKSSESEPITQAKQIFAAIADTTLEAGSTALRQRSRERPADSFSRTEPAEWDPEEDPDNEDELMIILDDNEQVRAKSGSYKSRSQSQSGDRSTGFSHLDDFEKRLAEMQDDLDTDEHKANKEPIYATILPKTERAATGSNRMTDDGYFINRDEELPYYEPEEDVGSEYSRKKVSFAQSEERFEFDVPKKESSFRSFTKFLAKELPLNFKRDPTLDERLARNDDINGLEKENIAPVAPRRSKSKTRSQSLQRYSQPAGERENMTARSQSLSRTGDDISAKSFFSAMTGGLYDPNISGSRGLRGSRPTSRQSSGDRSSLMSYEEDPSVMSGSEMMSDSSVFGQLKKIKLKQAKKVEQADFDKLFARGMEMSAMRDGSPEIKKVQKKRTTKVPAGDGLEEAMKKDNGIGYAEKVMSYLDDQAKAEMMQSEVDGCHVSRSRRKLRHKGESRTASESEGSKAKQSESRNRSREYTKPEDIKLSPVIKRDLFTGEIIFVPSNYKGPVPPAPAPPLITTEHVPVSEPVKEPPTKTHTQSLAPSPGKHFLDATTGQEVFGASIEGDNPELTAQLAASELLTNGHSPQKTVNSSAYEAYETIPAGRKKPPPQSAPAKVELPADKGIPSKLKPDKLLANEEFYEELRESMRQVEASQEDTETFTRYSHHLGRAEFGTLKKRTSTRPSAATSRDPSGDRVNLNRSLGVSRDPSGDRLALAKQSALRSESRTSAASGLDCLPDLEVDVTIPAREESGERPVHRTVSLLVAGVHMDTPSAEECPVDVVTKREEVLREMEEKKLQIREAKAWIQNGLMTVVGFGVMAYLQTLESMGT